jgi:Family of unknown function (DUF5681)
MADKSDKVGYGRPPVHSRFKPGQSGNPRGRPKGTLNFTTDLKRTLQAPVTLNDGRKTRRVTTQEAALLRLAEKALKGDPRALEKLVSLSATLSANNAESPSKTTAADDQAILDRYRQLILNETNSPFETDDDGEK